MTDEQHEIIVALENALSDIHYMPSMPDADSAQAIYDAETAINTTLDRLQEKWNEEVE